MTEHDNCSSHDDDAGAAELFDVLKQLEPSLNARVGFRVSVASELARMQTKTLLQSKAWWQKSISIPVPVAMSAGVLLIAGLWFQPFQPKNQMARQEIASTTKSSHPVDHDEQEEKRLASTEPKLIRRQSNIYLCGLGPLSSETRYVIED